MENSQTKRLKTAVKEERWEEVKSLLRNSNYDSGVVDQFITACEQYDVIYVDHELLTHCNTEQRNRLLKTAVKKERWSEVKSLLRYSNYDSSDIDQFITACEEYDVVCFDGEILTHCITEQGNRLLKTAVKKERWEVVKFLLRISNYSSSVFDQFIAACEEYDVVCFDGEILYLHCNTEQGNRLLKTAVKKERWEVVKFLLRISNYSSSVVDQLITACEEYDVFYVDEELLTRCTTQQLDRFLTSATTNRQWNYVDKVLWIIEGLDSPHCTVDRFILSHINDDLLSRCSIQQMDRLLTAATTRGHWKVVEKVLTAGGSPEKRVWAIEQACNMAADKVFMRYILPHCSDDQLESVLTHLVTRGLWKSVGKVLKRGVRDTTRRWAAEEASKTANDSDFKYYTLPHCSDDQLESVLTHLVTRGLWMSVDEVLERHVSDTQYSWTVEEASKTAGDLEFKDSILPHCSDDQLESVLTHLVTRGLWRSVGKVLERGVSDTLHRWTVEEASKTADDSDFKSYILPHCSDDQLESVLTHLVTRGLWESVGKVLERGVSDTQHRWAVEEANTTADDSDFKSYILPHCRDNQLESVLTHLVTRGMWWSVWKVLERGVSDNPRTWALSEACKDLTVKYNYTKVMTKTQEKLGNTSGDLLIKSLPLNQLSREAQNVALRFALQQRRWDLISRASLSQVWEQVRRLLFREAVYQKKWKVVKKCSDHTLYDDERWWALEEAYKHKQWDVMLQLADHGLTEIELMRVRYRLAKHADWDVVLRMIERGVDVTEVREVLESTVISRKTRHTTDRATQQALALRWKQLRQLEEKLTRDSPTRLKLPSTARQWRIVLFHLHRHPGTASVPSRSQPCKTFGVLLLQRAIEQRRWHVVMHLVRLGIGSDLLDSLLTDMISRRQWSVCRVLLEQLGVSFQSCLIALSVFIEKNQWTLVARVIEFIVDDALKDHVEHLSLERSVVSLVLQCVRAMCVGDAVRLQVMQRAMERREGSVVGECISTMQHYCLSVKEREELLQQAISRGVLQAVKPLVEEKDETGIKHRDIAMLAAIEQRQWDVVDCCQLQGADIDMKDEHGETPLNREVRKEDMNTVEWKAVEELVVRGADPNVLDKDGCSVLNRAIYAKQWDIARLLIEYHGDIHMRSRYLNSGYSQKTSLIGTHQADIFRHTLISIKTPLEFLIDTHQADIIHHTLIWCPDQANARSSTGETTLHAIALDKKPELMYYQIVRGVNPLTLTKSGQSVLFYAVGNKRCPRRMVGECIRLGFSTHQPRLTLQTAVDIESITDGLVKNWKMYHPYDWFLRHPIAWHGGIISPFLLAVLRGMPVVAHMLYESGSCSSSELLHLYTALKDISDPHTEDGRKLDRAKHDCFGPYRQRYDAFMNKLHTFLPYLREMASTPRSLKSTCRLVISHCLTVRRRHERAVRQLPIIDREMEDYVLFSDLTHPDFKPFLCGICKDTELGKRK